MENEFKEWSDEDLQKEAKALDFLIYEEESYGVKDVLRLTTIVKELEDRNFMAIKEIKFIKR